MKNAFPPIADAHSRILILGTMPGERSLHLQQYYGNRQNHFWKLLFTIYDEEFSEDYTERIAFLKSHNIALWDVLASCERKGSLDSNIRNAKPNDFEKFYTRHPHIRTVFFSSKAAERYYDKYITKRETIAYYTLPSPSGANASWSFAQKLEYWTAIRNFTD